MDFTFADDARQLNPTRPRMGPLIAVGGIHVPDASVKALEDGLRARCKDFGFGNQDRFKWSPGPQLWMAANLVGERRSEFFDCVLDLARGLGVQATIVIEDKTCQPAIAGCSPEDDVLQLFLERVEWRLRKRSTHGVVIVDRPSGGRAEEGTFVLGCAEKLEGGTQYVRHERIALNVLAVSSDHNRSLQLADLVASCTVAHVAGERRFSPRTFQSIKSLLCVETDRVGGVGLKIHPDFIYANLYHWICGDRAIIRNNVGTPLPIGGSPFLYSEGPFVA